jgi:hypothetical protein
VLEPGCDCACMFQFILNNMLQLLPYLPDGGAEATESILFSDADVANLLARDNAGFWAAVRSPGAGLVTFLETYLQNAARPFDEAFADLSAVELQLWRNTHALLARL